jgi:hypothetical protein
VSLTGEQLAAFRRDGVLLLPRFFDSQVVQAWHNQAMRYFGIPMSSADWWSALRKYSSDRFQLENEPSPTCDPQLASVFSSLNAEAAWVGKNELVVRPGDETGPWRGPRAPHLDYPMAVNVTTMANTVLYLTEVKSRGGAFMYWPGSHHVSWRHHEAFPEDYLASGGRSQDAVFKIIHNEVKSEPVEFIGDPGDLLIWHSLLLHSASTNKQSDSRLAMFGRWGVSGTTSTPWNFAGDIWDKWVFAPAVS